jgi:hypothetical protein
LPTISHSDILLGVTTYNRLKTVSLAARSLSHAVDVDKVGILVMDDASTEYGLDDLRPLFPPHTTFIRRPENSGRADFAAHNLLQVFRDERPESILVCLDSDLLVAQDFVATLITEFPRTDGLLSLLNAQSHHGVLRDGLLVKPSVGFAGTVWSRPVVEDVLLNVPPTPRYDWDICAHLTATGREIFCLPNSAVQHLGLSEGQNSQFLRSDYGLSFTDTAWYNLSAIQEMLLFGVRQELLNLLGQTMTAGEMRLLSETLQTGRFDRAAEALRRTGSGAQAHPLLKPLSGKLAAARDAEAAENATLAGLVQPGWICMNVGPESAPCSLLLSRSAGASGQIYAFDPSPVGRTRLLNLLELEDIRNITVPQAMLSNRIGPASVDGSDRTGDPRVTLDQYALENGLGRVALLRLGPGAEAGAVLAGAHNLLAKHRPYTVLDLTYQAGDETKPIERTLNLLRMAGYTLCTIRAKPWPHVKLFPGPDYSQSFRATLFCYHGPRNDAHA